MDRWVKDQIQKVAPAPEDRDEEENPCASHWTNMANKMMAQMWAIFDKTGIFLVLCYHDFALVVADMVQSGEM